MNGECIFVRLVEWYKTLILGIWQEVVKKLTAASHFFAFLYQDFRDMHLSVFCPDLATLGELDLVRHQLESQSPPNL